MEQNREFRNKSLSLCSTDLQQGAKNTIWEMIVSSTNDAGKIDIHTQMNKMAFISYYIQI